MLTVHFKQPSGSTGISLNLGCEGRQVRPSRNLLQSQGHPNTFKVQALAVIFALFCFTWMVGFGLFFAFNSAFGFLVSSNTLE